MNLLRSSSWCASVINSRFTREDCSRRFGSIRSIALVRLLFKGYATTTAIVVVVIVDDSGCYGSLGSCRHWLCEACA